MVLEHLDMEHGLKGYNTAYTFCGLFEYVHSVLLCLRMEAQSVCMHLVHFLTLTQNQTSFATKDGLFTLPESFKPGIKPGTKGRAS